VLLGERDGHRPCDGARDTGDEHAGSGLHGTTSRF
jgi:hypothetical protein